MVNSIDGLVFLSYKSPAMFEKWESVRTFKFITKSFLPYMSVDYVKSLGYDVGMSQVKLTF